MTFGIMRTPFHGVICGYLLLAMLAAPLAILGTGRTGADGEAYKAAATGDDSTLVTGSIEAAVTQCPAEASLAGREFVIDPVATPHMGRLQFPDAPQLGEKEVLLTFDDGPHPERTLAILDILDK